MITRVNEENILEAAAIHSCAWQDSHRSFCPEEFIKMHTPERQMQYLQRKMAAGCKIYMMVRDIPLAVVTINKDVIEDLYVLPDKQKQGYGTELLRFAIDKCEGNPRLWILENNKGAEKLYRRLGFEETGRVNSENGSLTEIEFIRQNTTNQR